MVERWSSKSFMWVRFLLFLIKSFFRITIDAISLTPLASPPVLVVSKLSLLPQMGEREEPSSWPLSLPLYPPKRGKREGWQTILWSSCVSPSQLFFLPPSATSVILKGNHFGGDRVGTNLIPLVAPNIFASIIFPPSPPVSPHLPQHLFLSPIFLRGLVGALERLTGTQSILRVNFFLRQHLSPVELGKLMFWKGRLLNFQRVFGRTLFLTDSLLAFYFGLKFRDLPMLIRWLRRSFSKVSFWRYRSFLHFIRYTFRYVMSTLYNDLDVLGIRFRLKGKISVAGNARTRTIEHTIGAIKSTSKDFAILHELTTVNSFTGVLGLQIWLCYRSSLNK